jgi:AcrR family transcriptional regulator/DNA-binding MarR family transcriptional regulator
MTPATTRGARHTQPSGRTRPAPKRDVPEHLGVDEIQRLRIITAVVDLVYERGAAPLAVAHIVERSGVSRRTFYELFDDREDCMLAAFDSASAKAGKAIIPAYQSPARTRPWHERIRAALQAALAFLDQEPRLGYLCVVGSLAAGPRLLQRRAQLSETLVNTLHGGRRESQATRPPDRLVAEGILGAVLAIVGDRMQSHDSKPLLNLTNSLMAMIVLPYLGAQAAEQQLEYRIPRARSTASPPLDPLRGLDMRLTYRTMRVLLAIAELGGHKPSPSNRQVATAAGVADQGQISKLLMRLETLGLVRNSGGDHARGEPNAWSLTTRGQSITQTLRAPD